MQYSKEEEEEEVHAISWLPDLSLSLFSLVLGFLLPSLLPWCTAAICTAIGSFISCVDNDDDDDDHFILT